MTAVAPVMEDQVVSDYQHANAVLLMQEPREFASEPVDAAVFATRFADALRERLGDERYDLWFEGKTRITLAGQSVIVEAGHAFAVKWIGGKFRADLLATASGLLESPVEVVVRVREELALPACPLPAVRWVGDGAVRVKTAAAFVGPSTLNADYTLDRFVVGPSNQMAYHAALRVTEQPGRQFNPLFIHGHCGLGKTHLLQGICHRFSTLHPTRKWLYLTGEQFTNDYLDAIRQHKTEVFRRGMRQAELLVIDDVHFLANKKATQEEFLHTFNQIDGKGRQIVLASDCGPRQIQALSEQLSSRFVSGMVLRVDSPDLPTRLDILRRRVARHGWNINDTVLTHIARTGASSVRELEGLLLQVVAGVKLIDAGKGAEAGDMLASLRERTVMRGPIAAPRIVGAVAEHFALKAEDIMGSGREKIIAAARAVAMYLARQHSGMSFPEIGRALGGKNHSTVIAACQRVEGMVTGGNLLCWNTPTGPRHQSISDALHELEAAIRRGA